VEGIIVSSQPLRSRIVNDTNGSTGWPGYPVTTPIVIAMPSPASTTIPRYRDSRRWLLRYQPRTQRPFLVYCPGLKSLRSLPGSCAVPQWCPLIIIPPIASDTQAVRLGHAPDLLIEHRQH
jgi:5-formyltetrahydrofolate cyclo-ligase